MEITARGLTKIYSDAGNRVVALDGVDLTLQSGEVVVLLGPSGSGKTTLLNLLSGLEVPSEGEVLLDGEHLSFLSDRKKSFLRNRSFGFIFQFFNLLPEFTILENTLLPSLIGKRGREFTSVRKEAKTLLEELGLGNRAEALPSELSGGEKQRVAICRALINRPGFVFADEPTGNLDRENAEICLNLFRQMIIRNGTGFIIATHNQEIAAAMAARTVRLKSGKVIL
ncbi:MAG: ABC transporter ATP-binding protein [Candidatus Omnitrophota bacterium]